ncbi:hypothetical protein [Comamonas fluminis]|uniref:hypothetical protein n=1 Tax=Comamonas fluminis TaxID=2796366 RepID=UPI001C4760A6|nr:hypothetical protein [Comamonas fluminis]
MDNKEELEVYRGIKIKIQQSFDGLPGFYTAIAGTFDGGDRAILDTTCYEEMIEAIDEYFEWKKQRDAERGIPPKP